MTKNQLIGTWKRDDCDWWIHLYSDGNAFCELRIPAQPVSEQEATWKWVSRKRWQLRLPIAPQAGIPGLKDGAVEVIDYRLIASSPGHMICERFDYEHPFEFTKMPANADELGDFTNDLDPEM